MVASTSSVPPSATTPAQTHAGHAAFVTLLPAVERAARSSYRGLDAEARDDAVAEAVANAFSAFVRLSERDRQHVATATSLARFAVRQYFAGRRVGSRLNANDVLSPYARQKRRFRLEQLDTQGRHENWQDVLVEDRNATPAELAASRIDFPAWLETLPQRVREISLMLADGYSTSEVATRFGLTAGRISQLRRELAEQWRELHEESGRRRAVTAVG